MIIFGQPESYSDILNRIFAATLIVGIICTFILAQVFPPFHALLESWSAETSIVMLQGVKALYIFIPFFVAILSRILRLHNMISDLIGIRRNFDLKFILKPLAEGVGFPTGGEKWKKIKQSRKVAMTRTFYKYASFEDPKIDVQLVRKAADRWSWFWCAVEPLIIWVMTGAILVLVGGWQQFIWVMSAIILFILLAFYNWDQLEEGAKEQVAEILNNTNWKVEVSSALDGIS